MTIPTSWCSNGKLRAAINLGNPVLAQRAAASGELTGVSVVLARQLAHQIGCVLELLPYGAASEVVEANRIDAWDVAFLAIDRQRATQIAFTEPYLAIEGVLVVAKEASWQSIDDIDRSGVRIAVGQGAAYDLHLSRVLKHAELVRLPTSSQVFPYLLAHKLEAGAGIRQPALGFTQLHPELRVIEKPFMEIRQAMALPLKNTTSLAYLEDFLLDAKQSGLIASALVASGQAEQVTLIA